MPNDTTAAAEEGKVGADSLQTGRQVGAAALATIVLAECLRTFSLTLLTSDYVLAATRALDDWALVGGLACLIALIAGPSVYGWCRGLAQSELLSFPCVACAWFFATVGDAFTAGFFAGLACLVLRDKPRTEVLRRHAVDSPVDAPENALMDRRHVVDVLAAHLTTTALRCPRVALTAPLGAGKTSVANFVGRELRKNGHRVVLFDPWRYRSVEEAREALLATIEDGLEPLSEFRPRSPRFREFLTRTVRGLADQFKWAQGISIPVERLLRLSQAELAAAIHDRVGLDKRLVVIVDDLERAPDAIALDVLMYTREVLDVDGLAFLFAVDDQVLCRKLPPVPPTSTTADPLDKFFDFRRRLPEPDAAAYVRIDEQMVSRAWRAEASSVKEALGRVRAHLPSNPRERKQFLQTMRSWPRLAWPPPFRLSADLVLLFLLLDFETPGLLEKLLASPDHTRDLGYGLFKFSTSRRAGLSEDPDLATTSHLVTKERERQLYRAARECAHAADVEAHLRWLLFGYEVPEREEALRIAKAIRATPEETTLVEQTTDVDTTFKALTLVRVELLHDALDAATAEEQRLALETCARLAKIRRCLVEKIKTDKLILSPESFLHATGAFFGASDLAGPFVPLHTEEWEALQLVSEHAADARRCWHGLHSRDGYGPAGGFGVARAKLSANFGDRIAREFLTALAAGEFADPAGPKDWESTTDGAVANHILFDVRSGVFGPTNRDRFLRIVSEAVPGTPAGVAVASYWQSLVTRAHAGFDGARGLLADLEITQAIWRSVTARPLTRREMARLHGHREVVAEVVGLVVFLPEPAWWQTAEAEWRVVWSP